MKRILNSLAVGLFLLGFLVVPAVHRAVASHHSAACASSDSGEHHPPVKHNGTHCGICQLAHAPLLAAVPVPTVIPVAVSIASVRAPSLAPVMRPVRLLPFSCGPPV